MNGETRMHLRVLAFFLSIILALIPSASPSVAQSDSPPGRLLFTEKWQIYLSGWTHDEKYLRIERGAKTEYFEIATGRFVKSLQSAQLTAAELVAFSIEPNIPDESPNYVISPDGVYVVYIVPSEPDDGGCAPPPHIWLANRQTQLTVELPFSANVPIDFDWGSDGSGLVITGSSCEGLMGSFLPNGYIWNFSPTLSDFRILDLLDPYLLQGQIWDGYFLNTATDGLSMLVAVPYADKSSLEKTRLVLINVPNPEQSKFVVDNLVGFLTARLLSEASYTIVMLSAFGLTELSLTGQLKVLDARLTSTGDTYICYPENYVMAAAISPSGKWLAYVHCDEGSNASLYLLDLYALRHPNRPTPTIAPTFTPIGS